MKLKETIYLSLAAVAVVIGIHRTMLEGAVTEGVVYNYWLFMTAIIFLMLYRREAQKRKHPTPEDAPEPRQKPKKKPQKK